MGESEFRAAMAALPDPDFLTDSKTSDPPGSGTGYLASTVLNLIAEAREDERRRCADLCDDVASECNSWEENGDAGRDAAMMCAARLRSVGGM